MAGPADAPRPESRFARLDAAVAKVADIILECESSADQLQAVTHAHDELDSRVMFMGGERPSGGSPAKER